MPVTIVPASAPVTVAVSVVGVTETVIATLTMANPPSGGFTARLLALLKFTAGTGQTSVTLRWRRNSLTGTVVGVAQAVNVTAANTSDNVHAAEDAPGDVANQVYVLTATQAGGAGNGSAVLVEALGFWF